MEIKLMKNIMSANTDIAEQNREYFKTKKISALNIMASPGAGKTSIIMKIIENIKDEISFSVVEGDIASSIDAKKISDMDVPVVQINTGGGCHLDANMIKNVIDDIKPKENSVLFIENVGNLVCPSVFDLGECLKIVVASVPEGHDKPHKYTSMFAAADVIILNKIDLIPYIDFEMESFLKGIKAVNKTAEIFEVSCKTNDGIEIMLKWIKSICN